MTNAFPHRPRLRRPVPLPALKIVSLAVKGLFGKIDYSRIEISAQVGNSSRIAILYGDNGTGKTTLLRLIYACISPEPRSGLRTLIAQTSFLTFQLNFSNNGFIRIDKKDFVGSYTYTFEKLFSGTYQPLEIVASSDGKVSPQASVEELERVLRRIGLDVLFVDHNRVVSSTYDFISTIPRIDDEYNHSNDIGMYIALSSERYGRMRRRGSLSESDLHFPLPQVVSALEGAFRSEAYRQGAAGDQDAAAVYLGIAKSLSRTRSTSASESPGTKVDVIDILSNIKLESASFIKHGLLSQYPFDEFINVYNGASVRKKPQIHSVLGPFLDSLQRRLTALRNLNNVITNFEAEFSKYFREKKVNFSIESGFSISDADSILNIDSLSSGEKQLVFLLCAAALARSRRSLILIDEPELSLNYKWQRLIAGSLDQISTGSETQYILASHSIEIITRYVESSTELIPNHA